MPTFPLPCWTTNCELPMVNPWPLAMVVVPEVLVNWPRPKYPVPLAVKLVVEAPPDMVKRPLVMVEEASERKPFRNVARPVAPSVEARFRVSAVSEPSVAFCEKRFVELAVVLNSTVVVALPSVTVPAFRFVLYRLVELAGVEKRRGRIRDEVPDVLDGEDGAGGGSADADVAGGERGAGAVEAGAENEVANVERIRCG